MKTFEELGVESSILLALIDMGFEYPMPVQEKVIPVLLSNNRDIVALAQTGTGKTAAFGIPLIQNSEAGTRHPQAVVLCPTRELCLQITQDLVNMAKYSPGISIVAVYGGASIEQQIKVIRQGVQIIVATPGRLIDLINRKAVKLNEVKTVVLDEADEMLNMGFQESLNEILSSIPEEHSTLLFSATMPPEVASISRNYMNDPLDITVGHKNSGAENIRHLFYLVHAKDKYTALKRIVDYLPAIYGIVFCRTRMDTQEIANKLIADGYNADALHGDLTQAMRDSVMHKFRIRHTQLLVATDVAARGLDVDDLTHIINYSLPDDIQVYTHRSGRTGRAGKAGTSIAIINMKERHLIKQIEKSISKSFEHVRVPGGREICEKQLFNLVSKMENVEIEHSEIDPFLPAIYKKLEWLSKEEVVKRFVALEFNRFLEYYRHAGDINVSEKKVQEEESERKARKDNRREVTQFSKLVVNAGKADGLYPANLIELINRNSRGKRIRIGEITLDKHSVVFEADSAFAAFLTGAMVDVEFKGKSVTVTEMRGASNAVVNEKRAFKGKNKRDDEPFTPQRKKREFPPRGQNEQEPAAKPFYEKPFPAPAVKKKPFSEKPLPATGAKKRSFAENDEILSEKEFREWMASGGDKSLVDPFGKGKKKKGGKKK